MLQVFDSWASELTPYHFKTFALPALQHVSLKVRKLLASAGHPGVPITLFAKGANAPSTLRLLADPEVTGYDTLGLDWTVDPVEVRQILSDALSCTANPDRPERRRQPNMQGNFDPTVLYGGRDGIEKEVARVCERWKLAGDGWIANLGHGITPNVKPEDMGWFLECVHTYSAR